MGPCEVLKRYANTGRYQVSTTNGPKDLHMDSFKLYLAPASGKPIPCWFYKPPVRTFEKDTYVVEKILRHRIKNGRMNGWSVGKDILPRMILGSLPLVSWTPNMIGLHGINRITSRLMLVMLEYCTHGLGPCGFDTHHYYYYYYHRLLIPGSHLVIRMLT